MSARLPKIRGACALGGLLLTLTVACAGPEDGANTQTPLDSATPTPTASATPTAAATPTQPPGVSPFYLEGAVPSNGAMAVPRFPEVQLAFSEDIPPGAESAIVARFVGSEGETIPLHIDPAREVEGDDLLALIPDGVLEPEGDYRLEVEVSEIPGLTPRDGWPISFASSFSTRVPCGVAFNIAEEIQINALGGNAALVRLLQQVLEETSLAPVALMFVDTYPDASFPLAGIRLVAGLPIEVEEDIYAPDRTYGYPVSVDPCQIDAQGALTCEEATFVFPIPITDETVIYLAISRATLRAQAETDGAFTDLNAFTLEGVITEEDLIIALEAAGLPSLVSYIKLDVDLDGDGRFDAARASASSNPGWLQFDDCLLN